MGKNETVVRKEIEGFPGYAVDTDGNVWSRKGNGRGSLKNQYKKLKPHICNGYSNVVLCRNKQPYPKLVHRLVLETFVSSCPDGMECCHNDGNRKNNKVENLRWDSRTNNHKDAVRHGTAPGLHCKGEKNGQSKLNKLQIRIIRKYPKYHGSQADLAEFFGISRSQINAIIKRRWWRWV